MKTKLLLTVLTVIFSSSFLINNCQSQWQPDVRLTNNPAYSYTSYNNSRCVASFGSDAHIVWHDNRDDNYEIYYKHSTDGGLSWGTDIRLTNNSATSFYPSIALVGTNIHVVWTDYNDGNTEIYYKHSTDNGVNWGASIRLTNNTAYSLYPSISAFDSIVHVVWEDERDNRFEIYDKYSTDGGLNWSADVRLTNKNIFIDSHLPSVSVSGSFVHTVWYDQRDGNWEIYYKRSTNNGVTWEADKRLTNNPAESSWPSIAVLGSVVNIVWRDYREGNFEIYYKCSTDGGLNWESDKRLTNDPAYSVNPSVVLSGSNVHLVWGVRDGKYDIYYKRSTNGGINWGADTRLSNDYSMYAEFPSIAISELIVHVVWMDYRDGNYEIYYKRNPTGNPPPCNSLSVNAGIDTTIFYGYGEQKAKLTAIPSGGTGPYSYLWSDNSTTQSITVNPAVTTTYYVTVTDKNSCHAIDEVNVNVIDLRCGNNNQKVLVCHNGKTICISANAVSAHLNHGDVLGNCGDNTIYEDIIPNEYQIFQNYPNPFNPVTNIKYDVPLKSLVKISVFDISGREVETLVNEQLQPGTYSTQWNASAYSSGVYFYKITAGDFVETKKMLLIK